MVNKAEVLLWHSYGKHLGGLLGQTLCKNKLQNTEYSAAVLAYKIAFVIQHAKRMRRIILSSVVYASVP